jgi:hypothetical protein
MCEGLRLEHTYLCRGERGGSLPDEVGSSPPKIIGGRRRTGMMNERNLPQFALVRTEDE